MVAAEAELLRRGDGEEVRARADAGGISRSRALFKTRKSENVIFHISFFWMILLGFMSHQISGFGHPQIVLGSHRFLLYST